jgi:hypothetical protein
MQTYVQINVWILLRGLHKTTPPPSPKHTQPKWARDATDNQGYFVCACMDMYVLMNN